MPTQYRYNTLNQVTAQKSPDGGRTDFWYDRLGRLAISRNAKQRVMSGANSKYYSYTKYDFLGRITEVGQVKDTSATTIGDVFTRNPVSLDNWHTHLQAHREQVTSTVYDTAYNFFGLAPDNTVAQQNVRNRVSFVKYSELPGMSEAYDHASFYSYDIHGNVDTLVQDYGIKTVRPNLMNKNGNRWKKIVYEYDLISGKVNTVKYQPKFADQWTHRYFYDAENRLTEVQTSEDGITWEKEAKYEYYLHGPLACTTLGHEQVQGIDYAYTLQGWLKGINSAAADTTHDMGGDARSGLNKYVGRDALGFALNYYDGEYKPIKPGVTPFPSYRGAGTSLPNAEYRPLYNGNISSALYNIRKFEENNLKPYFYNYRYDQLIRYVGQDSYNNFEVATNSFGGWGLTGSFRERTSYDANGNIQRYLRHSLSPDSTYAMDSLSYAYYPGTNQLQRVRDNVPKDRFGSQSYDKVYDIDDQDSVYNYKYDSIGNLIEDKAEKITSIQWNVYGKITEIRRNASITDQNTTFWTKYRYDAQGNRIAKEWLWYDQTSWDPHYQKNYTWYVRDAQGNLLSTYSTFTRDTVQANLANLWLQQEDIQLYGSSRLGMYRPTGRNVDDTTSNPYGPGIYYPFGMTHYRGERQYELTNHLGNVLTTISDRKIGVYSGSSLIIDSPNNISVAKVDFYEAEKKAAFDYFPFGMIARMNDGSGKYRFGFNGKENDNEVKGGIGSQQDYGMRVYDPRIGRFLSVDPLTKGYPMLTPYQFASNRPVDGVDLDGGEFLEFMVMRLQELIFGDPKLSKVQKGFVKRAVQTVEAGVNAFKAMADIDANLTPMNTATGGMSYVKNMKGQPLAAASAQLFQNIKDMPSLMEMVRGTINDYADLLGKASEGDQEAIGGVAFEAGLLFIPFGNIGKAGAFKNMKKGFAFFTEGKTYFKNPLAKEFEDATVGAMSLIETKSKYSPGLFFENPSVLGNNYIKFDGHELVEKVLYLVDSKWNLTTKTKQIRDLQRMSRALYQNPTFGSLKVKGIIEVPDEAAFRQAQKALQKAGVNNIEVRIRKKQ